MTEQNIWDRVINAQQFISGENFDKNTIKEFSVLTNKLTGTAVPR